MFNFLLQETETQIVNKLLEDDVLLTNMPDFAETGIIISISDGIVLVRGLESAKVGELVLILAKNFNSFLGQALNLNEDGTTGVVLFGDDSDILPGFFAILTGDLLKVKAGYNYLGSIVDALGLTQVHEFTDLYPEQKYGLLHHLLSDKYITEAGGVDNCVAEHFSNIEEKAPGIITRQTVNRSLYTGIKAIDGLIPVGRGQRELIIGDRQTGKTTICVDTILRQNRGLWINEKRLNDVFSIYVAIGQKRSSVLQLYRFFLNTLSASTLLIVAATASESSALQFLAPYTGVTFGEFFRNSGKDALIIYDDLSKHAVAYRQMSLLLRRPPGREAYPGDVFYLHSRLLERAAQLNSKYGGGSLTALPIIETQGGDVTAYIPTNVISITDGQIFLEAELFYKSIRPAINMGLSVSRVGSTAQLKAMRQVAGSLKLQLAQFRELEAFVSFGGELDAETRRTINRGLRLVELLKQMPYNPYDVHSIIVTLYAGSHGFLDSLPVKKVLMFEKKLIQTVNQNIKVVKLLKAEGHLTKLVETVLIRYINQILKAMK